MKRIAAFVVAVLVAVVVAVAITSTAASAQRRGRFFGPPIPNNPKYDGSFQFCRIYFRNASNGDGGGWGVDYPRADENLTFRLSELTSTLVSQDSAGNYNHIVTNLTDALTLEKCPFTMLTEPGGAYFDDNEAASLRTYLQHGGFLWADDFWGGAWDHGKTNCAGAPSSQFTIRICRWTIRSSTCWRRERTAADSSIGFWAGLGGATSERGRDSAVRTRAQRSTPTVMLVFTTHNTDFGDAFEREGDMREYFQEFASKGYAVGVNVILYAMTH
jgi:hypothetical protein